MTVLAERKSKRVGARVLMDAATAVFKVCYGSMYIECTWLFILLAS